jgi:hypothetical protein
VHETVQLDVCRGGVVRTLSVRVDDLHALTPGRYLEVGGGVVNELSYQQARNHGIPARGVYVAHPGYMLRQGRISRGCIIDTVNGVPTPDLDSFVTALAERQHGDDLTVRFYDVAHRSHIKLASLTMDRKWFPAIISERSDPRFAGTDWTTTDLPLPAAAPPTHAPRQGTSRGRQTCRAPALDGAVWAQPPVRPPPAAARRRPSWRSSAGPGRQASC